MRHHGGRGTQAPWVRRLPKEGLIIPVSDTGLDGPEASVDAIECEQLIVRPGLLQGPIGEDVDDIC